MQCRAISRCLKRFGAAVGLESAIVRSGHKELGPAPEGGEALLTQEFVEQSHELRLTRDVGLEKDALELGADRVDRSTANLRDLLT